MTAPNQPRPYLGSPQEAPAIALLICTVLVAMAGTMSVNTLMNVSKASIVGIVTRDSNVPVGYVPGSGTH